MYIGRRVYWEELKHSEKGIIRYVLNGKVLEINNGYITVNYISNGEAKTICLIEGDYK